MKYYQPEGFSKRLYECVIATGLSVHDFAKRCDLAPPSIYAYFYNERTPNITALARMCKTLNVSADYLLFGKEV